MYPKLGQSIEVNIINENLACKAIIADIGEEDMHIAIPMTANLIGRLSVNRTIEISFVVEKMKYQFQSKILGRKKEKIPLFQIEKPLESDIIKIQQREDFRVKATLPIYVGEKELSLVDISAGGVLCSYNEDMALEKEEEVSGKILLPNEQEPIDFKARIVRVTQSPDENRFFVAMRFTELDKDSQAKIRKFCFERQRELRILK